MFYTGLPAVSAISPMKAGEETRWRQRKAWIWIYEAIMREGGEMIGKLGEEFFASVFSGLGLSVASRGLDSGGRVASRKQGSERRGAAGARSVPAAPEGRAVCLSGCCARPTSHRGRYVTGQVFRYNNRATKDNPLMSGSIYAGGIADFREETDLRRADRQG